MKKDRAYRTAGRIVRLQLYHYRLSMADQVDAVRKIARAIRAETRRCIRAAIIINPVLGGISDAVDAIRKGAK